MYNAYEIWEEVRNNLNEAATVADLHWTDLEIMRKMNQTQRKLWMALTMTPGDWFLKQSSALTPSSNLITLPTDCAKPVYVEEVTSGVEIPFSTTVRNRRVSRIPGTTLSGGLPEAYMLQSQIEINADSYTNQVYLWYIRRIPDMHFGTGGAASGANALELESAGRPRVVDDYYNGVSVALISGTGGGAIDTITDYVASTRVATISGTTSTDTEYGTVSELPEEAIEALVWETTLKCVVKPSSTMTPEIVTYVAQQAKSAKEDFFDWVSTRINASQYTVVTEYE